MSIPRRKQAASHFPSEILEANAMHRQKRDISQRLLASKCVELCSSYHRGSPPQPVMLVHERADDCRYRDVEIDAFGSQSTCIDAVRLRVPSLSEHRELSLMGFV